MNIQNEIDCCIDDQSKAYYKYSVISIELWIIMLSGSSSYKPLQNVERIFLSMCLLSNIIIAGTFQVKNQMWKLTFFLTNVANFQGTLTTSFSTTSFFKDINTLAELDKSGLIVGTTSNSLADIFGDDPTPIIVSLRQKFKVLSGVPIRVRTSTTRDICCIERLADIKLIIAVIITNY